MATINQSPEFRVERLVRIIFDSLDDREKELIGPLLADRERFLAAEANAERVEKISDKHSLYALRLPSNLLLAFSKIDDAIVVVDLMSQETFDQFRPKGRKSKPVVSKPGGPVGRATEPE